MNQARLSELNVQRDELLARRPARRLAVATGDEASIASPALELQKALEEMLNDRPMAQTDYARGVALTAITLVVVGACSVFWWTAIRWAFSIIL